ncbi:UNVERIFIED_CONTAM: hypothetical protein K2H54_040136 [Gekko kuhli]
MISGSPGGGLCRTVWSAAFTVGSSCLATGAARRTCRTRWASSKGALQTDGAPLSACRARVGCGAAGARTPDSACSAEKRKRRSERREGAALSRFGRADRLGRAALLERREEEEPQLLPLPGQERAAGGRRAAQHRAEEREQAGPGRASLASPRLPLSLLRGSPAQPRLGPAPEEERWGPAERYSDTDPDKLQRKPLKGNSTLNVGLCE